METRTHKTRLMTFVASVVLLVVSVQSGAAAQPGAYRSQPPLYSDIVPETKANVKSEAHPATHLRSFKHVYKILHSPRVVVFWGRMLSSNPSDTVTGVESIEQSHVDIQGKDDKGRVNLKGRAEDRVYLKTHESEKVRRWLPMQQDSIVRASFESELIDAGVRLVDRSVAMRLQANITSKASRDGDQVDLRRLEFNAVKSHAKWLIEVIPINRDSQQPYFQVRVSNVRTGNLLASLTNADLPLSEDGKAPETQWEAGPDGFVEVPVQAVTGTERDQEEGSRLADSVMQHIAYIVHAE